MPNPLAVLRRTRSGSRTGSRGLTRNPFEAGPTRRFSLKRMSPGLLITLLSVLTVLSIVLFLTIDLRGNLSYALTRRGIRVGAMLVVAVAVGVGVGFMDESALVEAAVARQRIGAQTAQALDVLPLTSVVIAAVVV